MSDKRLIDANALPMYKVKIVHSFGIVEGSVVFPDDIKKAHTIDAVPVVHGWWELGIPMTCSACGKPAAQEGPLSFLVSDYCPNCGAKMDAKEEQQ